MTTINATFLSNLTGLAWPPKAGTNEGILKLAENFKQPNTRINKCMNVP